MRCCRRVARRRAQEIALLNEVPYRGSGVTMPSGKFLPFKYYRNEQGVPDYGFKEVD